MHAGQHSGLYRGLGSLRKELAAASQATSTKDCSQEDEPRTQCMAENGKGYLTSGKGTTLC